VTTSIRAYGDRAVLVEIGSLEEAQDLARALMVAVELPGSPGPGPDGIPGLSTPPLADVITGLSSVVVRLGAGPADLSDALAWIGEIASRTPVAGHRGGGLPRRSGTVEIPVAFDGADLADVATNAGLTPDQVISACTSTELTVAFLGFAPGFPYLVGLPPALAAVGRRTTPRPAVPPGSVALGGGCAGIYPAPTAGGWQLVGTTSFRLFDPDHPPYARLAPGDRVRFRSVPTSGVTPPVPPSRPVLGWRTPVTATSLEVIQPGPATLVEDGGRWRVGHLGVPAAGAADPDALLLANRLVGNRPTDAVLEITGSGPVLAVHRPTVVGLVGEAEMTLDGHRVPTHAAVPVEAGQVLAIGAVRHPLRAVLGVTGGIRTPMTLGSRSADLQSGVGIGRLRRGDRLELGPPGHPRGRVLPDAALTGGDQGRWHVSVLPGPHHTNDRLLVRLVDRTWRVGPDSDRMGIRLSPADGGAGLPASDPIPSTGMVTGAVQLPGDGMPIVLLPDHGSVGGYPVVATVISADLGVLGRCRPGDHLTFDVVDLETACRRARSHPSALERRVVGWLPAAAGT